MTEIKEDVYEILAQKLDSFPSGYPKTDTGIEIRLLKKIFSPQEAAIVNDMQPMPETASQIAERTGRDPNETAQMLQSMIGKGQVMGFPMEGNFVFMPLPFIVGIYFFQVPSLDEELAKLFEEYYAYWAENTLKTAPTYHRVLSVDESVPVEFEVFPYESVSMILKDANSFGLYPCMCKLQKKHIDGGCDHPTNTCLVFSQMPNAFDGNPVIQTITKDNAFKSLKEFEEAGLVHTMGNFRETNPGMDFICNCCSCGCTFLRGVAELGIENSVAKTNFYAVTDAEACTGCETCLDRCQFNAITIDEISVVDKTRCAGCGLCVIGCPSEALSLARRSEDEIINPPHNIQEWNVERAKSRGLME